MICGPGRPRQPFPASARSGSGSPSPRTGARWGDWPLGLGKGCVPGARQLASASAGREGRPGCYRAVARRAGEGGALARGTGWRGAQGSRIFPRRPGPGVCRPAGGWRVQWAPQAAECSGQGGDAGGQGAAVSRTPEPGRREAEGGVSTSPPVPLLGKGRRDGEGEARRERQRNRGAFNQHPPVRPTRRRRNKWTGEGGAGSGRFVRKCRSSCGGARLRPFSLSGVGGCCGGCSCYRAPGGGPAPSRQGKPELLT